MTIFLHLIQTIKQNYQNKTKKANNKPKKTKKNEKKHKHLYKNPNKTTNPRLAKTSQGPQRAAGRCAGGGLFSALLAAHGRGGEHVGEPWRELRKDAEGGVLGGVLGREKF